MVIRVYVSGISGNKEVKKRQQRVLMILESKNIPCEIIDITEPGKESDKEFMQQNSKPRGDQKHPLPPQIFNDDEYCGDFLGFDLSNENEKLLKFLKMAVPTPPPETAPAEEDDQSNMKEQSSESESESEPEPTPSRPRPRPPPKAATGEEDLGNGNKDDQDANKNQGMDDTSQDDDERDKEAVEGEFTHEDDMATQENEDDREKLEDMPSADGEGTTDEPTEGTDDHEAGEEKENDTEMDASEE